MGESWPRSPVQTERSEFCTSDRGRDRRTQRLGKHRKPQIIKLIVEWNYLDKQIIQLWRNHRNQQNTAGCTLLGRQNDFQATSWNQSTAAIHFQCNFCSHSEKLAKWLQTAWQALHKPCTTDQRSCFPRLFNFVSVPNIQMYTGSNFGGIFCVFSSVAFYGGLIGALSLCLKWFSLVILSSASEK